MFSVKWRKMLSIEVEHKAFTKFQKHKVRLKRTLCSEILILYIHRKLTLKRH